MSPSTVHDLINAMDECIATTKHLAELGPALDEGGAIYWPHVIELLALIAQQAGHLEHLSVQLARGVLPRPRPVEGAERCPSCQARDFAAVLLQSLWRLSGRPDARSALKTTTSYSEERMHATSFADLREQVEAKMHAIAEYGGVTTNARKINEVCRLITLIRSTEAVEALRQGDTAEQVLAREELLGFVTAFFAEEAIQYEHLCQATVQEFLERTGVGGTTEAAVIDYWRIAERVFTHGREDLSLRDNLKGSGRGGQKVSRDTLITLIDPDPEQPRKVFNEAKLAELAESMAANGLAVPILLRPMPDGRFLIVHGERRWRAAQRLGWETIPAEVRELTPDKPIGCHWWRTSSGKTSRPSRKPKRFRYALAKIDARRTRQAYRQGSHLYCPEATPADAASAAAVLLAPSGAQ